MLRCGVLGVVFWWCGVLGELCCVVNGMAGRCLTFLKASAVAASASFLASAALTAAAAAASAAACAALAADAADSAAL